MTDDPTPRVPVRIRSGADPKPTVIVAGPSQPEPRTLHLPGAADAAVQPRGNDDLARGPLSAGALGRYAVATRIGGGGMGEVYVARDPELERDVAIKLSLDGGLPEVAAKFLREARITGQLEHPGVVPVYDLGRTASGEPFFAMRRVGGIELEELLVRDPPPPLRELLSMFVKVCDTMGYAHACGFIHRDLKPSNVMTGAFGEVYVMDWGLAKRMGGPIDDTVSGPAAGTGAGETLDGTVMGTPHYMPPEQAEGRTRDVDARSDIYALGAILYRILAGVPPYRGKSAIEVLQKIADGGPPLPSKVAPRRGIPRELEAVAMKALARDPARRYPTALALRDDVEAFLAGRRVGAARYTWLGHARRWLATHPLTVRVTATFAACALAWGGLRAVSHHRAVRAARQQVEATQPERWLEVARGAAPGGDARVGAVLGAGERSRQADTIAALQRSSVALAELLRVAPGDDDARAELFGVLGEMGRLAAVRGEYAMAQLAYSQAAGLGVADDEARALAERAAGEPARRLLHRRERIAARVAQAHQGALAAERAFYEAVIELASYAERQTVDELIAVLDDASNRTRTVARDALMEGVAPAEEAAQHDAIEAWIDPLHAPTTEPQLERVRLALARLAPTAATSVAGGLAALGDRQLAALREGGLDRARAVELACQVLSQLADPEGAVGALERCAWAEADESRAVCAGLALVALSRQSPAADRAVLRMLGLVTGQLGRFGAHGTFSSQVTRAYKEVGDPSASLLEEPTLTAREWVKRGLAHQLKGELDAAIHAFDRALELEPQNGRALDHRADARRRKGDLAGARADLERALVLDPDNAVAHACLGQVFYDGRNLDLALEHFGRAIALDPAMVMPYSNRGNLRQERGDLTGAVADYTQAIALDPRYPGLYSNRGNALKATGDFAGALADYDAALALDPRDGGTITNRGNLRYAQGDVPGARADFERAIALGPKLWQPHAALALALQRLNQPQAARESMRKAIDLAPPERRARLEEMLRELSR